MTRDKGTTATPEVEVVRGDPVALAVFSWWLKTGGPATIAELAAELGWDSKKARREISKHQGSEVPGCLWTTKSIPVRHHSGCIQHWRDANALVPSMETLRAVVSGLRDHCGVLHRELHPELYLSTRDDGEFHSN